MRIVLIITMLGFALASNVGAQPNRKPSAKAQAAPFDEADALFGKRKRTAVRKAHDKYANQEVSYRRAKGARIQGQPVVFEPNNEPLWTKRTKRRKQVRNRAKNYEYKRTQRAATFRYNKPQTAGGTQESALIVVQGMGHVYPNGGRHGFRIVDWFWPFMSKYKR